MMKDLYLYNTLSKKKEKFKPLVDSKVKFYYCGPTVYWVQHIGNLRGSTMADLVHRILKYLGYRVSMTRNYTDVGHLTSDEDIGEDKMAKGARREGLSPQQIADKYIKIYQKDTKSLNILEPLYKPRATEYISQMIESVRELIDKGYAYITPKAAYFDITKSKDYGKLGGQKIEEKEAGAGQGEIIDPDKRNPQDFAIWFFKTGPHKNALQYWASPFDSPEVENGEGFPGWHLECSVMSRDLLGDTIDIHMGGIEHIPVHHTNEIAQSEALTGKTFVNYWIHNEHLLVEGGKMSKSAGTSYTVQDIVDKGYDPLDLRYLFLNAHYRSRQDFTWDSIEAAKSARGNVDRQVKILSSKVGGEVFVNKEWEERFIDRLSDDLDVPGALAVVWQMLKSDLADPEKLGSLLDFDKVLGLRLEELVVNISDEERVKIDSLVREREFAKQDKDFNKADEIRNELKKQGIVLEDTKEGTDWYKE